jgi:hypothetical protein
MTDPEDVDGAGLGRLLTNLADDPDAPPSSVSALSVIAAATAPHDRGTTVDSSTASSAVAGGVPAVRSAGPSAGPPATDAGASVGELHVLSVQRDADRRAKRRRTMIFGGLAAACAVALAAVVIPIAVSNSSSTTTAGAAADQSPARAEGAGAAAAAPTADAEAPADQGSGGGAAVAPTVDPSNPDANRPPPGESALSQTVPVPGGAAPTEGAASGGTDAGGGVVASCWPALSDAASGALVGALPAGAFGAPGPLGLGCPADPVGGAQLAGTAPDTQLVVRVTRADPGACARSASETGARCVARGGDQYVSNDAGNLSVYAYGTGYEVEVGGRPATGIAPIPSGLTADQLSAAAGAVLGALS